MSEWKECTIGDLGEIITGRTPRTAISENYGGKVPFLSPSDNMELKYVDKTNKTLTEQGVVEVRNCLLPANAICVSCIGSDLGKVLITTQPTVTNQQINSIIVNEDNDTNFIYYLMTIVGKHLNFISKTSTAVPIINKITFSNYKVSVPPISKQKKIAAILSSLDEKIETNRKINARLEELAQTLFKSWLSKCEDTITIGEIAQNILDYTPNNNSKVRLINSSEITEGIFDEYPLIENKNLKGHFKKRFQKGDILYSEIRPRNHHYGYALMEGDEYIISTRLMVIRNDYDKVTSPILYQYLLLPEVEANFTAKTEGRSGTFPQGTYKDLENIKVPYSTKQDAIDSILRIIRNKLFSINKESSRLAALRDTLLPKLMSGELIPE